MTTIAVKRREDGVPGVVFAADEQVSAGNQILGSETKIFVNGPVVFGFAGSVRDKNLLEHALKVPAFKDADKKNPAKWVVTKLVPAIRKTLESAGSLETHNGYSVSDSHLVIAVEGLCGYLSAEFALTGTDEAMWAVGSGSDFALGAMSFGASPAEAVAAAGLYDAFTGHVDRVVEVEWT